MVAISKQLFDEFISDQTCENFIHPNYGSCLIGTLSMFPKIFVGTGKFYAVIYLIQTLLKGRILDREYLKQLILVYGRSIAYGMFLGIFNVGIECLLANLFGLRYYNVGFVSGTCAGCAIFVESMENRIINTILFFNMSVEAALRYLYFFELVERTRLRETLSFMLLNSLFMYLLTSSNKKRLFHYWFYLPAKRRNDTDSPKKEVKLCGHVDACSKYIRDGFSRYFLIGYAVNLARTLIPKMKLLMRSPRIIIKILSAKKNFLLGLFFGAYVGIYRAVSCLLMKNCKVFKPWHSALAGFLAGSAYSFEPRLQLLSLLTTNVCQALVNEAKPFHPFLSKLPLMEILFCICNGYLLHINVTHNECCPQFYSRMLNTASNGFAKNVHTNILNTAAKVLFPNDS